MTFQRRRLLIRILASCGLAACIGGAVSGAHADTPGVPQAVAGAPAPVTARLQVTGTRERFTVDADHAPVVSALKALFDQADLQFAPDATVAGVITLRLSGQSLKTVLDSICREAFLQYHVDEHGIYYFGQNPAAIRAAIESMKALSTDLTDRLTAIGIDAPAAGGFAGNVAASATDGGAGNSTNVRAAAKSGQGGSQAAPSGQAANGPRRTPTIQSADAAKGPGGPQGGTAALPINVLTPQDVQTIFNGGALRNMSNATAYGRFLLQNQLVAINTGGSELPVVEVLHALGKQVNVPILVDPGVPSGPGFSIRGVVSPRPLPEAMNLLCSSLRLEWRWIGGMVYVTPAAEFNVFFGDSANPRVSVPAYAVPGSQRGRQPGGH